MRACVRACVRVCVYVRTEISALAAVGMAGAAAGTRIRVGRRCRRRDGVRAMRGGGVQRARRERVRGVRAGGVRIRARHGGVHGVRGRDVPGIRRAGAYVCVCGGVIVCLCVSE